MQEKMNYDNDYAKYIDHTVLKVTTTKEIVKKFCDEAKQYGFKSVCINSCFASFASKQLAGTNTKVCVVVGFPLGANTTATKVFEAKEAIENGATEIDMVMNIGALLEGDFEYVSDDMVAVIKVCHPRSIVKVIIESSLLSDEQIVKACELAKEANVDFVKTSTGFSIGGATTHAVELMKKTVGDRIQVKASTGINSREICDEMLAAGATRMGTSKGIAIVSGNESITGKTNKSN